MPLLEHGADVHVDDDWCLRYCVENNFIVAAAKLLEYGADIHAGDGEILKKLARQFDLDSKIDCSVDIRAGDEEILKQLITQFDLDPKIDCSNEPPIVQYWYGGNQTPLIYYADMYTSHIGNYVRTKPAQMDEPLVDLILQYCSNDDYKFFPSDYVRDKIMPTKNARSIKN